MRESEIMGKKMKLPFLSNQTDHHHHHHHHHQPRSSSSSSSSSSTWPWPSCTQTRTLSFRTTNDIFKTMNTTFLDTTTITTTRAIDEEAQGYDLSTNSSDIQSASSSTAASEEQQVEAVIQGLRRSERLFFEPGKTSSILEEANKKPAQLDDEVVPFKESVALSLESQNPYLDFKLSMEEMVEAHGIKEWEGLEELLCWYLKVNGKDNHGYIVGAFVDLLVGLAFNMTTSTTITTGNDDDNNNNNNSIKPCRCSNCDSPYSPLSYCNTSSSSSSSMSSSSTPNNCVSSLIGVVSDQEIETPCLSSLVESTEEEVNEEEDDDDVSS